MPSLSEVRQSNATLASTRPDLTAVFVGGTSGIGEATAKQLAKAIPKPTIHLVGRNPESGSRILEELRASNPNGTFRFVQADVSLLQNVDTACAEIKAKEDHIDLLFMSTGHLAMSKKETPEGLENNHVLRYYSRMRFTQNLLPLLQASRNSPRVVTVLGGGQEGTIELDNLALDKSWTFLKSTTYAATMNSLAVEHLAAAHPDISFLHVFPGLVRTPLINATVGNLAGSVLGVLSRPFSLSMEESGERNLFLATSAAYPSAKVGGGSAGGSGTVVASSTGKVGGGSYILGYDGKNATQEKLMADYRGREFPAKVWQHTLDTFQRVLRSE
ncbi:short-chain dehydrogenases/reductase [Aspergillus ellipticus CBS 707.79]|uniref:Short-chain dehydrogenases/reductase n=1 Tax=Aspergillus ellipticus CBS 707.79 TaxID=1448320 RepID=A0A319DD20_9EURO|nr:short-chain dehydrogenases/reductase [Aspergillus ellipticus CBS 707.79]